MTDDASDAKRNDRRVRFEREEWKRDDDDRDDSTLTLGSIILSGKDRRLKERPLSVSKRLSSSHEERD